MATTEKSDNLGDGIPRISILGVKVNRVDMTGTLDAITRFIASGTANMIVTADASMIAMAQDDADLKNIINEADLVTPDGSGIVKGAKILGTPLAQRVSGVDLAREMCRMSAEQGFSIYFLGAEPGVADAAAQNLSRTYPGMKIAGTHDGYFTPDRDSEIASLVKASGAQALLVAMGIPRQEKFIKRYMHDMGVCVAMGVGGSFDVFSGKVKRAPKWFQDHGLEWAYRLCKDPSKIKKVSVLPKFLMMVYKERLLGK
ncbi:MAG: WecB/TagA/CpsF family glycosyltransferase [Armatimonadota bacterium]|nr:WecB/TagA/CpsF family glycosyltransferase [bacterium]